jgi:hypothetical protein
MDSYMASNGSCFMVTWIIFQKPPFGGRPNTKVGDLGTPNARNRWFILFYHVWGPAWIKIHWNGIWLRAQSHTTSNYTWGSVTTLHDFGGVLGRPLDTFFWALTISRSRLLAHVWSGPKSFNLWATWLPNSIITLELIHRRFNNLNEPTLNPCTLGHLHCALCFTFWRPLYGVVCPLFNLPWILTCKERVH